MGSNQEYQMHKMSELRSMVDDLMNPCTEEEDSFFAKNNVLVDTVFYKRIQQIMNAQNDLLCDMILDLHSHYD